VSQGPADFGRTTVQRASSPKPTLLGLTASMRSLASSIGATPQFSPLGSSTTLKSLKAKSQELKSRLSCTAPSGSLSSL
jgi:hypothetical protein